MPEACRVLELHLERRDTDCTSHEGGKYRMDDLGILLLCLQLNTIEG